MISAEQIEAMLADARKFCIAHPCIRIGQATHDQLVKAGLIKFNPVVGTLDDFTSGNTNPYWVRTDGGVYTDIYELKDPEYVSASLYNEFWDGSA